MIYALTLLGDDMFYQKLTYKMTCLGVLCAIL